MSYIPKNKTFDSIYIPKSEFLKTELNTINNISLYSSFSDKIQLPESDKKWLRTRIRDLAKGLFLDDKKIIISRVGGYSGCPDKMIDTFKLKNTIITNLKFCYSCTGWSRDDYFIETFNSKMYGLMNIKAPDYFTYRFHGEFINKKKNSSFKKLELNQDRSFKLWKNFNGNLVSYSGYWENDDTILELDLSKYDELNNLKLEYNINRGKITGINVKNIKFKKPD